MIEKTKKQKRRETFPTGKQHYNTVQMRKKTDELFKFKLIKSSKTDEKYENDIVKLKP